MSTHIGYQAQQYSRQNSRQLHASIRHIQGNPISQIPKYLVRTLCQIMMEVAFLWRHHLSKTPYNSFLIELLNHQQMLERDITEIMSKLLDLQHKSDYFLTDL